ncbi:MAG TPA: helix-turn-helix domain-containing protein [Dehalococcoidia bacterium]|nr:helix-turn-helix domain-containing protein [Dehalococcoidia bacterium]
MSVKMNGRTYYRTAEVCQIVGIGRSTLFRWLRQNVVKEAQYRDRKGWRLFTEEDLRSLAAESSRIQKNGVTETSQRISGKSKEVHFGDYDD